MQTTTVTSSIDGNNRQGAGQAIGRFLQQRVWLPKIMYELVPYFYLTNGMGALWATVYVTDRFWFLPVCIISATVCLHLAYYVFSLRRSAKQAMNQKTGTS